MFKNVCLLFSQLSDSLAGYKTLGPHSLLPAWALPHSLLAHMLVTASAVPSSSMWLFAWLLEGLSSLLALRILEYVLFLNALAAFLWAYILKLLFQPTEVALLLSSMFPLVPCNRFVSLGLFSNLPTLPDPIRPHSVFPLVLIPFIILFFLHPEPCQGPPTVTGLRMTYFICCVLLICS